MFGRRRYRKTTTLLAALVLALASHADGPSHGVFDGENYACGVNVPGDYDDPSTGTYYGGVSLLLVKDKVFLVSRNGWSDDQQQHWLGLVGKMAGSKISFQIGEGPREEMTLPVMWTASTTSYQSHDMPSSAMFDISGTPLALVLMRKGNPPTVTLEHEVLLYIYRSLAPDDHSITEVVATFDFVHYDVARAYCERLNAEDEGGWFD